MEPNVVRSSCVLDRSISVFQNYILDQSVSKICERIGDVENQENGRNGVHPGLRDEEQSSVVVFQI